MPKERNSESLSSLSDEENSATKAKKSKPEVTEDNEKENIDLTGNKFARVSHFKGRDFVDIREFYLDKSSGEMKPGKKGIALNMDQWKCLKTVIDLIDKRLTK